MKKETTKQPAAPQVRERDPRLCDARPTEHHKRAAVRVAEILADPNTPGVLREYMEDFGTHLFMNLTAKKELDGAADVRRRLPAWLAVCEGWTLIDRDYFTVLALTRKGKK